ncbi:MAG: WD40 repeat domain-containing protein [Candidatus Pacebacteria bacterium]|nr:WD40 repeat domain-containing protein [Candidatus Paceibacterota bacterium]
MTQVSRTNSAPIVSQWAFNHFVTAVAVNHSGESPQIAFALGNGTVRLLRLTELESRVAREVNLMTGEKAQNNQGAILSLVPYRDGFLAGGDDGHLSRIDAEGQMTRLAHHPRGWIESLAISRADDIGYGFGKSVGVMMAGQSQPLILPPLPSTVAALLWLGSRLAVAHFGGVTIFDLAQRGVDGLPKSRPLKWPGSHIHLSQSPDGNYLASALRDGEIHVWRLSDLTDMRMAGYPGKVATIAWGHDGLHLAGSGIPELLGWGFAGDGPEGKEPELLWPGAGSQRIVQLASAKNSFGWAMGLEDGQLCLLLNPAPAAKALVYSLSKRAAVSALVWSDRLESMNKSIIAAGCEDGKAIVIILNKLYQLNSLSK